MYKKNGNVMFLLFLISRECIIKRTQVKAKVCIVGIFYNVAITKTVTHSQAHLQGWIHAIMHSSSRKGSRIPPGSPADLKECLYMWYVFKL